MPGFDSFALRLAGLGGDIRTAITSAARLKYSAVALDVFSREMDLTSLAISGIRDIRATASRHALQISALWLDLPTLYLGPNCDLDQLVAKVRKSADAARGLGAAAIIVQVGMVHTPPTESASTDPQAAVDKQLAAAGLGGFGLILPTPEEVARLVQRPRPTGAAASPPAARSAELAGLGPIAMRELAAIADHHRLTIALATAQSPCLDLASAVAGANCKWLVAAADTLAITADGVPPDEFIAKSQTDAAESPLFILRDGMIGPGGRVQDVFLGQGNVPWNDWAEAIHALPKGALALYDPTGLADRPAAAKAALAFTQVLGIRS